MLSTFKVTFQPQSRSLSAKGWREFVSIKININWQDPIRLFEFQEGKTSSKEMQSIKEAINMIKFNCVKFWWRKEILPSVHGTQGYVGMHSFFFFLLLFLELFFVFGFFFAWFCSAALLSLLKWTQLGRIKCVIHYGQGTVDIN